jgi:pseudouridine kinase
MFVMTSREQEILALIRKDPMIPQQEIASRLGISRSAVAGHIMKLTSKGIIKGRGYVVSTTPFVAAIGGANMDIHGKPARALRRHDSNPGTVHSSPGGVARNIAENLARLGADCRLISVVGNDHYGQLLLQQCRDAGIDMQHVQQIDSAHTSTYLSVLDRSGDMHIAINDMAIIEALGPERLREQETLLKQAALIILDTNLRDDALAWVTETLAGKPIFVDAVSTVKAKKIKPYLAAIHTLKASLIEAEALSGMKARTQAERRKLAAWAHRKGVARLFITLGRDGVFYSTNEAQGIEKLQRETKTLENAGGAGDAFVGGLAYAWLEGWALMKSVRFALAAAEVTLSDSASSSATVSLTAVNRVYESQHVS